MTEELLPCPFCGGNVLSKYLDGNNPGNDYWIHCDRCGGSCGMQDSKEEAIKAWNTRRAERSQPKVKWPDEKYSTALKNGHKYASDYEQGWNDCLDACRRAYEEAGGKNEKRI